VQQPNPVSRYPESRDDLAKGYRATGTHVSDLQAHLDQEVDWARRKLANLAERRDLDNIRDGLHWELVNTFGLSNRQAAERVRERLLAAGLTDEQIRGLGVSEHSMKAVTRLRRKP
jgi:hypothetical protein